MGNKHSHPRAAVSCKGATCIESEPAHPEHTCAGETHGQVVRHHWCSEKARARAQVKRRDECADACGDMHDRAASEVDKTHLLQPAATPDPVCDGEVDEQSP